MYLLYKYFKLKYNRQGKTEMKEKITPVLLIILIPISILFILILLAKNNMLEDFYGGRRGSNRKGCSSRSGAIGRYNVIGSGGSRYGSYIYPMYNSYHNNPKPCSKREDCNSKNCLQSGVCSPV